MVSDTPAWHVPRASAVANDAVTTAPHLSKQKYCMYNSTVISESGRTLGSHCAACSCWQPVATIGLRVAALLIYDVGYRVDCDGAT